MRKVVNPLRRFLQQESASGILILLAAVLGLVIANGPWKSSYFDFFDITLDINEGFFYLHLTVLKFINYVLMTIFFFVVGLEIKRELTSGHLATFRKGVMPFIGAIGGMAFPAAIYLLIADKEHLRGWGIPVATDIALAVGLLTLFGSAVAPALRTFLLGLAVIDDIGAILIIAFIYSTGIDAEWSLLSAFFVLLIVGFRKFEGAPISLYLFLGVALWYCIYRTGVHATLSGVILGLLIPNKNQKREGSKKIEQPSVIESLIERLHPWSAFIIVPIFAFANTGVEVSFSSLRAALDTPFVWAIFFGLVVGKPLGIFITVMSAHKAKIGVLPEGSRRSSIFATGNAAGVGFTVAIFIAQLAFSSREETELAVIAIIAASLVSGLLSWILFTFSKKRIIS